MKVLVFDKVYVPGYGMGPFTMPIEIEDPREVVILGTKSRIKVVEEPAVNNEAEFTKQGFPIRIRKEIEKEVTTLPMEEITKPVEHPPVEDLNPTPEIVEEAVEEKVEVPEIEEEQATEEIKVEGATSRREELEALTINELKAKLDEMKVPYLYKETKTSLIDKIIENE